MRVHAREIEVFLSSNSPGNVYHHGEKAPSDTGLYCETVMSTRRKLLVPNALKDPVWEVDKYGVYTYSSPAVRHILGYELDEVLGKTPFDLMPAEEAKRVAEIFGAFLEERKPINYLKNINLHKDGRQVILETCGVPYFDPDGIFMGYRGVDRDITDRKREEEAMHKYSEEVRDLYEHAPCGYHSLDKDGVFVRRNETELAWIGYKPEEVIGKMLFSDLVITTGLQTFHDNFPLFIKQGWIKGLEFEIVRKDGTFLPVLLSATAIYDDAGNYLMSRCPYSTLLTANGPRQRGRLPNSTSTDYWRYCPCPSAM